MTSFVEDDMEMSVTNLSVSMADMTLDDSGYALDPESPPRAIRESSPISDVSRKPDAGDVSPSVVNPPSLSQSSEVGAQQPDELDPDIQAFEDELKRLNCPDARELEGKFVVILSTDAYKHVFSRSWVSKKELASVVERPERLKACYLGIGLARTIIPFNSIKSMGRKSSYSPHVQAVHGEDWPLELYALCSKAAANLVKRELEVPETWPYYDIYLSPRTIEALEGNVAAMERGVDEIFKGNIRRAFITVRPPGHHCHEEEASGFCIMNNCHIAIQYAKSKHQITHAVILDFDSHHGDGNQDLSWKLGFDGEGKAETPMGYFSIHDINSFPCETGFAQPKQVGDASICFVAHNSAIWNVHSKSYDTDEEFGHLYDTEYSVIFRKAAEFLGDCREKMHREKKPFKPLIVLSAGFDGSEFETPGMQRHQVHVPTSFYNRFTRDSVALAENFGEGYLLSLLEGGYSAPALATGVFSHLTGLGEKEFDKSWCPRATTPQEVNSGMRQRWKHHSEKWTADGISLGRTIFPAAIDASSAPSSAPTSSTTDDGVKEKHHLRRHKYNWSL